MRHNVVLAQNWGCGNTSPEERTRSWDARGRRPGGRLRRREGAVASDPGLRGKVGAGRERRASRTGRLGPSRAPWCSSTARP